MGTNGCPQQALAARWRQSRQAMLTAPGMPGAARQILARAVKAQVTPVPASCPRPGGPGAGNRAIVRCRAVDRIPPGPGSGHRPGHGARTSGGCGTAPGPGSDASGPRPRAAADTGARELPTVSRLTRPEVHVVPARHRRPSRRPGAHSCR